MKKLESAEQNISSLESKGARILYGIDATKMLSRPINHQIRKAFTYGGVYMPPQVIVWNFPHCGWPDGKLKH